MLDLGELSARASSFLSDPSKRLACPSCHRQFDDFHYLMAPHVDGYLATAEQVIRAGHGRFLSARLRAIHGIE